MGIAQNCRRLSVRQARYAAGIAVGKPAIQAAKEAGYSESYAKARGYAIVQRPAVRSFLTDALERQGVTPQKIVKPIVEGLKANIHITHAGKAIETDLPDHRLRMAAADRALALYGAAIPKRVEMPNPPSPGLSVIIESAGDPKPSPKVATSSRTSP